MTLLAIFSTAIAVLLIPRSPTTEVFLILMLLYGVSLGLSGPSAAWFMDVSPARVRGTAMGFYRMGNDFAMFVGPAISGFLIQMTKSSEGRVQPLVFEATAALLFLGFMIATKAPDPVKAGKGSKPVAG